MKNIVNSIPGYKIYEYLLVLNPHEELRNKIMTVKQQFYDTYKSNTALYSKPHITLVNFVQYEMLEERLLHRLRRNGNKRRPSFLDVSEDKIHRLKLADTERAPASAEENNYERPAGQKLCRRHLLAVVIRQFEGWSGRSNSECSVCYLVLF